ncbi:MAG: YeeE/YedE family protein [bacterium]|nr:YeeE/YedE family protein [bacterium]
MTKPEVVLAFLNFDDFGLMLVMAGGIAVTALAFHFGPRLRAKPPCGEYEPPDAKLRRGTVLGAVLFGIGWGVAGICPGAMLASLGTGNWPIVYGIVGAFLGAYAQGRWAPEE